MRTKFMISLLLLIFAAADPALAQPARLPGQPALKRLEQRTPQGKLRETQTTPTKERLYVDTHDHIVGNAAALLSAAQVALGSMDGSGIKLCFIMPMPQTLSQKNRLYADDLFALAKLYPGRFAVLAGGENLNVIIQQALATGAVSKESADEFERTARELIEKGAIGFGEMAVEHISMRDDHPYMSAPADHPLFLKLSDLAGEYDVVIDVHMEAIPEDMPMPQRLKTAHNPAALRANIPAFERLLAHNRSAKIVWAHLGWDNTGRRTVDLTRELLSRHPNLYCSVRVASARQAKNVATENFPLDRAGRLKGEWLALFNEFPERFVIGSDEIILGKGEHPSAGSIRATASLLEQLPEDLRRKIGYENASRIYKKRDGAL